MSWITFIIRNTLLDKFIIRNTISESKANPKLFWKVINELHAINITEL